MKLMAASALAGIGPTAAVHAEDVQTWLMFLATGPVKGRLLTWTEVQPRALDDASRVGQFLLRQGVGIRLKNDIDLMLGYHWQINAANPENRVTENRVWQQIAAPIYTTKNGTQLYTQWRLEQRMFSGQPDTSWRARAQFRLHFPLHGRGTFGPVLTSETMYNLNDANGRNRRGFEQQRTSIGVYIPLGHGFSVEAGYLNQRIAQVGPDRTNHVASFKVAYKFGSKKNEPGLLPDLFGTSFAERTD